MKHFRVQKPYNKDGKTNFRYTSKKSGVYLIYKNSKLVYVGMSQTDVYKTMYRHFQSWDDPVQHRTTYNAKSNYYKISCRVILTTKAQAIRLEKLLIIKHQPKDNQIKYSSYTSRRIDKKIIAEFIGTPIDSCPF